MSGELARKAAEIIQIGGESPTKHVDLDDDAERWSS
jgi:hypothetical protein